MCKILFISFCSILTVENTYSQAPSIHLKPYTKKEFKMDFQTSPSILKDTSDKRIKQLRDRIIQNRLAQVQGRYSHSTPTGTVYLLPNDNMPCLVPDTTLARTMPNGYKKDPTTTQPMPNPYRKNKFR